MRKLNKLSIFDECMNSELSESEMRETVGGNGNDYSQNWCFFNCMAYLHKEYKGYSIDASSIATDYFQGTAYANDDWNGTGDIRDYAYGPMAYTDKEKTTPNRELFDYMSNYFETDTASWEQNNVSSLFNENGTTASDEYVVGIFESSSSKYHAVIFTSYEDGKYMYYDPSHGSIGSVIASQVQFAGKVTGYKDFQDPE